MSNPTTPFNWQMPTNTDLVTDLPADFEVFGQAVATSMADLLGGTTGQVLSKATNADMDFTWVTTDDANAIQNSIVDAKGDLIAATANDTPARLAVGTNGHVLTADSTAATGIKWAAPAGGGKILQVVSASTTTQTSVTGTTFTDTNITASITPSSSTSKILILLTASCQMYSSGSTNQIGMGLQVKRGATTVWAGIAEDWYITTSYSGYHQLATIQTINYVDSPATTSATTYTLQIKCALASGTVKTSDNSRPSSIILMEVGA